VLSTLGHLCDALRRLCDLRGGRDLKRYWAVLAAANITKQRLASFDRSIKSEPNFSAEQCPGLEKDLTAYLITLKAVHSGDDLRSAAQSVMGYTQGTLKGAFSSEHYLHDAIASNMRQAVSIITMVHIASNMRQAVSIIAMMHIASNMRQAVSIITIMHIASNMRQAVSIITMRTHCI
jgi:hypothetical protein